MTEQPNRLGVGNVPITLDGEEYFLVPTLNAIMAISRSQGGIRGAIDAVMRMDVDVIVRVVQQGLGQQVARKWKNDLPDVIYRAGLTDDTGGIIATCVEYLHVLANGGKPVDKDETQDPLDHPAKD